MCLRQCTVGWGEAAASDQRAVGQGDGTLVITAQAEGNCSTWNNAEQNYLFHVEQ